ncbi:MAG: OadG family protein [Lachnospiraceae bacterium]|nr:OadG family protein [Lachnospiraceae bacterium]
MKKLLTMLCMLTCVLGLSACGSKEELSELVQNRAEMAKTISTDFVVPYMLGFFDDALAAQYQDTYDVHELEVVAESEFSYALRVFSSYGASYSFQSIDVDGQAILNGIASFNGTYASLGDVDVTSGFTATYEATGDEIVVTVPVTGTVTDKNGNVRTAEIELIYSNDVFLTLEGCTLNLNQSVSELMMKAAMDTLMGMGTVFVVLILISLIIWALGGIPKLQAKLSKKNKKEEVKTITENAVDNTIAQIIEKEENAESTDDFELIAVIAAAIAASEGAVSTDGFVVRSIRKRR